MSKKNRALRKELQDQMAIFSLVQDEHSKLKKEADKRELQREKAFNRFKKSIKEGDVDVKKIRLLIFDMSLRLAAESEHNGFDNDDEGYQIYQLFELLNEL